MEPTNPNKKNIMKGFRAPSNYERKAKKMRKNLVKLTSTIPSYLPLP
jgi:hypothetical protein